MRHTKVDEGENMDNSIINFPQDHATVMILIVLFLAGLVDGTNYALILSDDSRIQISSKTV